MSKKPPAVKTQLLALGDLRLNDLYDGKTSIDIKKSVKACRHFDLLRKPKSTVPVYADEFGLLVLPTFLISDSLSKNKFFDRLNATAEAVAFLLQKKYLKIWKNFTSAFSFFL